MLLEVLDLTITLGRGVSQHTVRIPELRLEHGEMAVLLGRSGSGKSVFLKTLAGLWGDVDVTVEGVAVFYDERGQKLSLTGGPPVPPSPEREEIFYLFQDPRSYLHPTLSVAQHGVLLEHRFPHQADVIQRFRDALGVANLSHKYQAFVSDLSGGEAQRLMLAIMRVLRPRLLLADEPLSAQDRVNHEKLRTMLNDYVHDPNNGCGLLLVTHEIRDLENTAAQGASNRVYIIEELSEDTWQGRKGVLATDVNKLIGLMRKGAVSNIGLPESVYRFLTAGRQLGMMSCATNSFNNVPGEPGTPVLEVKQLSFSWASSRKNSSLLRDISFRHYKESNIGLMGLSGVGKSTLAELLMHLLSGVRGEIVWFGLPDISEEKLRNRLQYVFQDCERAMAWEIGEVGRVLKLPVATMGRFSESAGFGERIAEIVAELKLDGQLNKDVAHLSGGQLRRAYIARSLVALLAELSLERPVVLVLDEATVGLDLETQYALLEFLRRYSNEVHPYFSIIAISHDPFILRYLCKRILVLHTDAADDVGATIVDEVISEEIGISNYHHDHTEMLMKDLS